MREEDISKREKRKRWYGMGAGIIKKAGKEGERQQEDQRTWKSDEGEDTREGEICKGEKRRGDKLKGWYGRGARIIKKR